MDTEKSTQKHFSGLTPPQEKVIRYLQKHKSKFYMKGIEDETNLKYCTVRYCLEALVRYKIISPPKKKRVGKSFRMKIEFLEEAFLVDDPTDEQKEACLKNKAKEILETHPEFGYWREQELSTNQIHEWHNEFGAKYESLQLSLRWCAFDMVHNNLEEEKDIKSPINWFYSIMKRRGGTYPKPTNYKSSDEIEEEILEARAKEKEQQAERMRKLRLLNDNLDHKIAFEEMMTDPESDLYKKCLETLPSLLQQSNNKKGRLFNLSMQKAYGKVNGLEGFDDVKIQDSYLEKLRKNDADTSRN